MTLSDIKQFVLAGNSTFTIKSTKVDKRYTYKVKKDKKDENNERYFVHVMFGADNTKDYRFLGWFYINSMDLMHSGKSSCTKTDLRFSMFLYFLKMLDMGVLKETCEFYPSGRCGRCGRILTTPESIERGIGPECYAYIGGMM